MTKQEKIEYLLDFYSLDKINAYIKDDEAKLDYLYEYSQPQEVKIEELEFVIKGNDCFVDSEDGYVLVEYWRNKGEKECIELVLANGITCTSSVDHLFQLSNNEWIATEAVKRGDTLITKHGYSEVVGINKKGVQTVYDLSIAHENQRYYTDDISSHNSGKSLFLQNLALNWTFAGMNVIYFSIELSEKLIAARFDSMVSGMGMRDVFKNISDAALKIGMAAKGSGDLKVKKLPESGTNCNMLRAYIQEYIVQTGTRPDAILVDYLDILHPNNPRINPSDMFIKDKFVSEELRALAHEFDVIMATGSQLGRGAVDVQEFNHSHIAGGISKINTADNVFAIVHSDSLKEQGLYGLQMLKTRSSNAVGRRIDLQYCITSMRITDLANTIMPSGNMSSNDAAQRIKNQITGKGAASSTPVAPPKANNNMLNLAKKLKGGKP